MRRVPLVLLPLLVACAATDATDATDNAAEPDPACVVDGDRPAGWADATHSNNTDPAYATVFERGVVHRMDITLAADDDAAMYAELEELLGSAFGEGGGGPGGGPPGGGGGGGPPEEGGAPGSFTSSDPSYVPATVSVDGATWCGVGMRYKGNSSLHGSWSAGVRKLPFRLDFDQFEDSLPEIEDQRFLGFKELSLGNGYGDATLIRDVLASELLSDRGVPAAENAFYTVYLDVGEGPVRMGLYTVTEDVSDAFAERVWGDDDGNLYKPDGDCADLTCFDADTFEKKSNEDAADYSDVQALLDALAADRGDAAAWRADLEAVIDVDGFLRWLAVNSAIENWDAYGVMTHNYYLYAVPGDGGRFTWIPWDHNLSQMDGFQGSGDPLLADTTDDWPLIRHVLDDPTYEAAYRAHLADALEGLYAEGAYEARAAALRAVIEDEALAEGEGYTFLNGAGAFEDAYTGPAGLYTHADDRRAEVRAALD